MFCTSFSAVANTKIFMLFAALGHVLVKYNTTKMTNDKQLWFILNCKRLTSTTNSAMLVAPCQCPVISAQLVYYPEME